MPSDKWHTWRGASASELPFHQADCSSLCAAHAAVRGSMASMGERQPENCVHRVFNFMPGAETDTIKWNVEMSPRRSIMSA